MRKSDKIKTLAIVACSLAAVFAATEIAHAGRGATEGSLRSAIRSGNADAIISELERGENIPCRSSCMEMVMELTASDSYEVREAAAWWFARRPAQKRELAEASLAALAVGDAIAVRNAADILGTFGYAAYLDGLSSAMSRSDLDASAKVAVVRALGRIANKAANPTVAAAMSDAAPAVRLEAVHAWRKMLQQSAAAPVVALVDDDDVTVRRTAAATVGFFREGTARVALEARLADPDPAVRRNAAWALGRIGDPASRDALDAATRDESGLVRMTAKAALREL